ncbi:MAG: hypothetical protein H0W39_08355 [Sphingomonas sp.]|nr:hypothetical protein [Sphingomonas sp.]
MSILLALVAFASPSGFAADYRLANPKAIELFEQNPRLMRWAVERFDSNGDGHLSILEADRAAEDFKRIADGDRDGRVTPAEYRSAFDFIVARWALR